MLFDPVKWCLLLIKIRRMGLMIFISDFKYLLDVCKAGVLV
jgi:hypothetical protein